MPSVSVQEWNFHVQGQLTCCQIPRDISRKREPILFDNPAAHGLAPEGNRMLDKMPPPDLIMQDFSLTCRYDPISDFIPPSLPLARPCQKEFCWQIHKENQAQTLSAWRRLLDCPGRRQKSTAGLIFFLKKLVPTRRASSWWPLYS